MRPFAEIGDERLRQTSMYIDVLLKWNQKINLTAIRDPQEIITRHFGESFFAASHLLPPDWRGEVIDVGSGAGFPGLPMAMYSASAAVTLIESQGKKVTFLNEVIHLLGVKNAKVFHGRADEFPGRGDLVTLRAVEQFARVLPHIFKLVKAGGRLGLLIGESQLQAAEQLLPGVRWEQPVRIPGGNSRFLCVGKKS